MLRSSAVVLINVVDVLNRKDRLGMGARAREKPASILRKPPLLFSLIPLTFVLNGCWLVGGSQPPTPQNPINPSRSLKANGVQEKPEYKSAAKAFAAGDKATALRSLKALRAEPGLSASDQAFLDRQIAICEGKPSPNPTSQVPTARSDKTVLGSGDCGPRALTIAAKELGIKADLAALTKASGTTADGTTLEGLVKGAKSLGLKAEGVQIDRDALMQLPTPAIAWWEGNHFVAVLKISENAFTGEVSAIIHDPNSTKPESVKLADLLAKSGGIFLILKK